MKILSFSPYFHPYISGITVSPLRILTHLAKKHEVTVLTFPHKSSLPKRENYHGLKIIRLPYWFKVSKGYISPQSLINFYHEIKKADLVILNIPNFEGLPLALLARLFNKKIISIFHCIVYPDPSFISKIIVFFLNFSIYFQLLLSETIIGYTQDYANYTWVGKMFKKKMKFVLPPINNGIGANFNSPAQKKEIIIGFAGRVAREKGLEYLIDACKIVGTGLVPVRSNKGQPQGLSLRFAGPYGKDVAGENRYYLKIKKLLDEVNIDYEFLGNLSGKQLTEFYRSIDILALTSINSTEAFGIVQAEAMLQGTPVIATDLPGVRVPIKLTKMGIVVPIKNSQKIADAVIRIINNRNKYTNDKLVGKAKKIFDSKRTDNFYDELIKSV
jgi:glycosyltransferase involved in cell wall biosynthesis